jgi:hypothetical protein
MTSPIGSSPIGRKHSAMFGHPHFVDFADIRGCTGIDPALLPVWPPMTSKYLLSANWHPLRRRQLLPQKPQRATFRSSLGAVSEEERSPDRDGAGRNMALVDQPPTSLGKSTVSSAFGSNDRIRRPAPALSERRR